MYIAKVFPVPRHAFEIQNSATRREAVNYKHCASPHSVVAHVVKINSIIIIDYYNCEYYDPEEFLAKSRAMGHSSLSAFCINCQSLKAHFDSLVNLLASLRTNNHDFSVIGLTEVLLYT